MFLRGRLDWFDSEPEGRILAPPDLEKPSFSFRPGPETIDLFGTLHENVGTGARPVTKVSPMAARSQINPRQEGGGGDLPAINL